MANITLANAVSLGNPLSDSSFTITFNVTASTGNLAILAVSGAGVTGHLTNVPTDNKLNTWLAADAAATDTNTGQTRIYYVVNPTVGIATITLVTTGSSGQTYSLVFYDCAGADTSSPLESHSTLSTQGASTNPIGPSITPTTNGGIVVTAISTQTGVTAIASPFNPADIINGVSTGSGIAHNLYASAINFNPSWTQTSGTWDAAIAAFKPASSGVIAGWKSPTAGPSYAI